LVRGCRDRKKRISFVTGDAGVYAVAAAIYHALHNEEKWCAFSFAFSLSAHVVER
jgi:precorrin-3B methylase